MEEKDLKKIIKFLDGDNELTYDYLFELAQLCSRSLSEQEENKEAEKIVSSAKVVERIVIHILNKWMLIPDDLKPLWSDIAESIGFYPYIHRDPLMTSNVLADEIRMNYYRSRYVPGVYMHSKQKELSELIFSGRNVVVSAPTSFGKSLLIEEIVASHKYHNIVIIQPTLALLDETRKKMRKYMDTYKLIVRSTQRPHDIKSNIFLLTAERVIEYVDMPKIDFLIIDEFYKLSGRRNDDRSDALNNAFIKLWYRDQPQFYLLGPNIDDITPRFKQKFNVEFVKTDYSLVDNRVLNMTEGLKEKRPRKGLAEKKQSLFELLYNMPNGGQTLVYCSSPNKVRSLAREYMSYCQERHGLLKDLPICEWLANNFPRWSLNDMLKNGIGIHDASLQKHIGSSIIDYFNRGLLNVIFCTSTIIEGVNTSAKNVVVFDDKKGRDIQLDYFDYSNIKGRAGRLMEHYIGNVFSYIQTPPREELIIDIPLCDQDPVTPEVLVNIPEKEVAPNKKELYDKYQKIPKDLLDLFKQNGINIKKQIQLYNAIEAELKANPAAILWKSLPTWNHLKKIIEIAEACDLWKFDESVTSSAQLTTLINKYQRFQDIKQIASGIYEYKTDKNPDFDQTTWDYAIEQAFHIHRQWFQYSVPKVVRVIDSIQRYICAKIGISAGSYSHFVQKLESDFLRENLTILIEYGIPSTTIRKLENQIPQIYSEDEVADFVRNNIDKFHSLMIYEKDLLRNV